MKVKLLKVKRTPKSIRIAESSANSLAEIGMFFGERGAYRSSERAVEIMNIIESSITDSADFVVVAKISKVKTTGWYGLSAGERI